MKFLVSVVYGISLLCCTHDGVTQTTPQRTFFAVIVSDIDHSTKWYQKTLKLTLKDSTSLPQRGIRQANLISREFHVELIEIKGAAKPENRIQGIFKVGLTVPKLDSWHWHFKQSKVNFRGDVFHDEITQMRSFIILDPDGNRIQFFGH